MPSSNKKESVAGGHALPKGEKATHFFPCPLPAEPNRRTPPTHFSYVLLVAASLLRAFSSSLEGAVPVAMVTGESGGMRRSIGV